ncbi:MAG: hypothetical protein NC177_04900 [Ruminococcus flavefaciens]|nr:hypothetical protein [Ruminococcus flavefaciens]
MSNVIIYPESMSASVMGKEFSAKTPTELYVAVMAEILKNRPQIIGKKETHFTADSVRAGQYTGTTRGVYINNTKVYIKTGFSTKDKWKGIEKTCQLAGLSFELSGETKAVTKSFTQNQVKSTVANVNNQNVKSTQPNAKVCVRCGGSFDAFMGFNENGLCMPCLMIVDTEKEIKGQQTGNNSFMDNMELKNKNIKRIYYGIKENNTLVHDDLGDWVLGEHKTPRGPEQLTKDYMPLYSMDELGEVNAYSYNSVTKSIYYAKNNSVYEREYYTQNGLPYYKDKKICDCNNIVNMLWACNMLFITEISRMQFKERKEYEFSMGDYGYMSDDYVAHLRLRIVNALGGKEVFRQEDFSAVRTVAPLKNHDLINVNIGFIDAELNEWNLKKSNNSFILKKVYDINDIIKKNNISYSKLNQMKDKIWAINFDKVSIFNDNGQPEKHSIKDIFNPAPKPVPKPAPQT